MTGVVAGRPPEHGPVGGREVDNWGQSPRVRSAPLCLLETISSDEDFPQYLVRALLFRIVTDWFNGRPATEFGRFSTAIDRVLELAAGDEC